MPKRIDDSDKAPTMSLLTTLRQRRDTLEHRESGFTLIELLVVVLIIGILAAIAIPIFLGVQNGAKDSALQSDLTNTKTAYLAYVTSTGTAPASVAALSNYGATVSTYSGSGAAPVIKAGNTTTTFCVSGTSNAGNAFKITNSTSPAAGSC